MTARGSAIPAAIDALIASLSAALPDVLVVDGMETSDDKAPMVLFVGLSDPDGTGPESAASSTQKWANLGRNTRDEKLTINLVAVAWNGDRKQKMARDDVFGMVDQIADLIQTDPTLGGSVLVVTDVSNIDLRQVEDSAGIGAYLPLSITCTARLS